MAKPEELRKKMLMKILQLSKAVKRGLIFHNHEQGVHNNKDTPKKSIKMIPDEAIRRRSKQRGLGDCAWDRHIYMTEPTSPTVSCMGHVKNKKQQCHNHQSVKKPKSDRITLPASPLLRSVSEVNNKKRTSSAFQRILLQQRGRRSSCTSSEAHGGSSAVAAPALRQMNPFASRRGALDNFDWKAQVVAALGNDDQT